MLLLLAKRFTKLESKGDVGCSWHTMFFWPALFCPLICVSVKEAVDYGNDNSTWAGIQISLGAPPLAFADCPKK
jgi:hypothetical protein